MNADSRKGWIFWKWIEFVALLVGFLGTAIACLANYNWHWFKESIFFMIWSIAPYGLLLIGNYIVGRLIKSRFLQPVTALLAVVLTVGLYCGSPQS